MKNFFFYLMILLLNFSCSDSAPAETSSQSTSGEVSESYNDTLKNSSETQISPDEQNIGSDTVVFKNKTNIPLSKTQVIAVPREVAKYKPIRVGVVKNGKIINVKIAQPHFQNPNNIETTTLDTAMVTVSAPPPAPPVEEIMPDPNENLILEEPKNAVLGFSYFPKILQNETRDLRVFVQIQGDEKNVSRKLKTIEKEDLQFTKTEDSSIVCIVKDIETYKKLSIKPIYDTDDFKVTKVDDGLDISNEKDVNEQELDFVKGNYWHWKIKAIAPTARMGNVTLLIKAETPQGQKVKLAERQINIKIDINQPKLSFSEKVYKLADDHFKEILSLIIIPIGLYLINFFRKKFAAKKLETKDPNKP